MDCKGTALELIINSCRRLGLTVLAYLWQRNQEELLSEMVDSGMNAVLIKVAGIGLNEKHLGRTLGDMQPILLRLVSGSRHTAKEAYRQNPERTNSTERMFAEKAASTRP